MIKTTQTPFGITLVITLIVLLCILLFFESRPYKFTVKRVIDGDTIQLHNDKLVRLIGVDTPEINQFFQSVEHYGREETALTVKMVDGKAVRLKCDERQRDEYGRLLASIYLKDGTLLNAEIIKQGYGHTYTRFPFKHLEEFRQYENEARENRRGLWAQIPQELTNE